MRRSRRYRFKRRSDRSERKGARRPVLILVLLLLIGAGGWWAYQTVRAVEHFIERVFDDQGPDDP